VRPDRQARRSGRPAAAGHTASAIPPHYRPPRRKALGQHHLRDGRTCRPLLEFLHLETGDRVLEIGAGGGVLTRELVATGARVVAIELDLAWAFTLAARSRALPRAADGSSFPPSLVVADALDLGWEGLDASWKIAGNLPYRVGTVIVERLLGEAPPGVRAAFLLQREVVDRLVARPGEAAYGALSLLVEIRARATFLGGVKPGAFTPPPKVESAFVGLETVAPPLPRAEMAGLERLIRAAFAQRRKTLRNSLGAVYGREPTERALGVVGLDSRSRAEELDRDAFLALFRAFPAV
jgi:16S rRNA (adenine1518-N6/adenine1519-N6)-dimethyltransferase